MQYYPNTWLYLWKWRRMNIGWETARSFNDNKTIVKFFKPSFRGTCEFFLVPKSSWLVATWCIPWFSNTHDPFRCVTVLSKIFFLVSGKKVWFYAAERLVQHTGDVMGKECRLGSEVYSTSYAILRFYVAERRVGEEVADGREAFSAPLSGAIFTMAKWLRLD